MSVMRVLAAAATALTIGGPAIHAQKAPAASAPATGGALTRNLTSAFAATPEDRQVWNCGMPVIQPPADIDPAFEKKPDDTLSVRIRRAQPAACGR